MEIMCPVISMTNLSLAYELLFQSAKSRPYWPHMANNTNDSLLAKPGT